MKKKRNLTPLPLTDSDLDRLSTITEDDLIGAYQRTKKALGKLGNILIARDKDEKPTEDESDRQ